MDHTIRFAVARIGALPRDQRVAVEREGVIGLWEGVSVLSEFTGSVEKLSIPTVNRRLYSGALAVTRSRLLATVSVLPRSAGRAVDHSWGSAEHGPARVSIDSSGMRVQIDVAEVDATWRGRAMLHYRISFTPEELAAIPEHEFTFPVPRRYILRLTAQPVPDDAD